MERLGKCQTVGSRHWPVRMLIRRVAKALALMEAIGWYSDGQGAFCLMRSCAGWAKTTPAKGCLPKCSRVLCSLRTAISRLLLAASGIASSQVASARDWPQNTTQRQLLWVQFGVISTGCG